MEYSSASSAKISYVPMRIMDKQYYYTDENEAQIKDPFSETTFLMVLDMSGSMCGGRWKALTEGAIQVATRIYEKNEFNHFITMFFNNSVHMMPTDSLYDFKEKISKVRATSTTNFLKAFERIQTYCERKETQDLTVLFLTDGNDTCNKAVKVESGLETLKDFLNKREITSRFFTIGFSKEHDSVLISKIAKAGSELGNFFYVDSTVTSSYHYKDHIKECLVKTFDLGNPAKSLSANLHLRKSIKKISLLPVTEEEKSETKEYITQLVLEELPNREVELEILGTGESHIIRPEQEQVFGAENLLKTEVHITNELFFDYVQKVVSTEHLSAEEAKEIYEKVSVINDRVSEMITETFKIKNRPIRKSLMHACQAFKEKCHTVVETLRSIIVNKDTLDSAKIAKLNDLAYKNIRTQGLKRKLDERAIKNREYYQELSKQIQERVKEIDVNKITQENQDIIDFVGDCPLTCLNAAEALEEGDCLGLCLDVARSTATIADSNQLIVKDVIPTFMCCSAYLDSATYNLERSETAAGTFDTETQGDLATGVGREKVTGLLPLYLFDDHWEISKRTIPSIFGFMCTLDIMGYSDDQFYTIPYTVLYKCYEKCFENNNDINQKMLKLVLQTCVQLQTRHKGHVERIINTLKDFENDPIKRGKDCIPNFKVFLAQILTAIEAGTISDISEYDWPKILRFLVEEENRRTALKGLETLTIREQSDFFNDGKTNEIVDKALEIKQLSEDAKLTQEEIKEMVQKKPEEDKSISEKDEAVKELIEDEIGSKPWESQLQNPDHVHSKGVSKFYSSINRKFSWMKPFIHYLNCPELLVADSFSEYPIFEEPLVVLAMGFQNHMHITNKARREAIDKGTYKEILTKEDAEAYFTNVYKEALKLEISAEETRILLLLSYQYSSSIGEMSLIVSNLSSFADLIQNLKVGDRGVTNLLNALSKTKGISIYNKLKIIITRQYDGREMFADEYKMDPGNYRMKSSLMFRFYYHYVYKNQEMTKEQFKELFPYITEDKIEKWIITYTTNCPANLL
ncbi:unnamed protein product [Moneuplotes crassus]|uniref:VWFA domain-containing protein n=1 Tax=Euplotes crassus TaxID=5936 RepID=A0AAD1XVV6_EUPCR|nr:unnamed protein product [Moneuplotes crassus]